MCQRVLVDTSHSTTRYPFALTATATATAMLIARLFDAVTDPLIGYYTDRQQRRTGSRKPMVLWGGLLMVPCAYFLCSPPVAVTAVYFTFWYIAFYVASTLFAIPQMAWVNEFTRDAREKTLVFSGISISAQVGTILFYLLPLLPYFVSIDVTPEILEISILLGSAMLVPGLLIALKVVPAQNASVSGVRPFSPSASPESILTQIKRVLCLFYGNKPFPLCVAVFMCVGIAGGMWFGLFLSMWVPTWGSVNALRKSPSVGHALRCPERTAVVSPGVSKRQWGGGHDQWREWFGLSRRNTYRHRRNV